MPPTTDRLSERVAVLVLVGGHSRRMGRPKAWLDFHGRPLLNLVIERVAPLATTVLVSAAPGQPLPPLPGDVVRVDDRAGGLGPLQGLRDGLGAAARRGCGVVVAVAVDLPRIRPAVIRYLLSVLGPEDDAVVPVRQGRRHPLLAVYRTRTTAAIEHLFARGILRVQTLLDHLAVRWVAADELAAVDPDGESFLNINTPEDYAAALRLTGPTDDRPGPA